MQILVQAPIKKIENIISEENKSPTPLVPLPVEENDNDFDSLFSPTSTADEIRERFGYREDSCVKENQINRLGYKDGNNDDNNEDEKDNPDDNTNNDNNVNSTNNENDFEINIHPDDDNNQTTIDNVNRSDDDVVKKDDSDDHNDNVIDINTVNYNNTSNAPLPTLEDFRTFEITLDNTIALISKF